MKNKMNSSKGQVIIEAILLIVIMMGLLAYLSKTFKDNQYMKKLVQDGPWPRLQGMTESGVWETSSRAKPLHPNNRARAISKRE